MRVSSVFAPKTSDLRVWGAPNNYERRFRPCLWVAAISAAAALTARISPGNTLGQSRRYLHGACVRVSKLETRLINADHNCKLRRYRRRRHFGRRAIPGHLRGQAAQIEMATWGRIREKYRVHDISMRSYNMNLRVPRNTNYRFSSKCRMRHFSRTRPLILISYVDSDKKRRTLFFESIFTAVIIIQIDINFNDRTIVSDPEDF